MSGPSVGATMRTDFFDPSCCTTCRVSPSPTCSVAGARAEPPMPDSNDPAERVRMLIYTQNYFRKSYSLAAFVEKNFIADGRISRGVQQRNHKGIWVLQATGMPSVLVEMGFISNKEDEAYLMSADGQDEIVNSILAAVKTYIDKYNTIGPGSLAANQDVQ